VGTTIPTRIVAPAWPAELGVDDGDELELPHADTIAPSSGSEIPTTEPRRMKSRRDILPAANSSMTWFATSPWPSLSLLRRRWSAFTGILP
jgi:hypothetical protein